MGQIFGKYFGNIRKLLWISDGLQEPVRHTKLEWINGAGEAYEGHYGLYDPHNGYIQDFYPYDTNTNRSKKSEFQKMLYKMLT